MALNSTCGNNKSKNKNVNRVITTNGKIIEDESKISQEFNKHCVTVVMKLAEKIQINESSKFKEKKYQILYL